MSNEPDELSVLDYFAAAALTGLLARLDYGFNPAAIYDYAEAMMVERAKRKPQQLPEATK